MPRFQKIVRAVGGPEPVAGDEQRRVVEPASSIHDGGAEPISDPVLVVGRVGDPSRCVDRESASPTPTTTAVPREPARTAGRRGPGGDGAATSAARVWSAERAPRARDGVRVLTSVSGAASWAIGTSAAPATSASQTGRTTASGRGAPRADPGAEADRQQRAAP